MAAGNLTLAAAAISLIPGGRIAAMAASSKIGRSVIGAVTGSGEALVRTEAVATVTAEVAPLTAAGVKGTEVVEAVAPTATQILGWRKRRRSTQSTVLSRAACTATRSAPRCVAG